MPRVVDAAQRRAELVEMTAREIARVGLERVTLLEDSLGRYVDRMWAGRPERQ